MGVSLEPPLVLISLRRNVLFETQPLWD